MHEQMMRVDAAGKQLRSSGDIGNSCAKAFLSFPCLHHGTMLLIAYSREIVKWCQMEIALAKICPIQMNYIRHTPFLDKST